MADFDLGAILNDPTFQTGLGMIGTNQALGPAFQQAAQAAQANKAAQQQNAIRQLQLQQLNSRANFNPSQYLLSNQAQNASPQAAGPATQAALAAQQGPQAGSQIAGNTQTPYQAPQGALGNVDIQGMLGAGLKAGMSPEEVQGMAGVIDPMTAIRMKLMSQPALVVPPGGQLVAPGMSQIAQTFGGSGGSPQGPQGGGAGGVLATNTNPPPDSKAAQIQQLTAARDRFPVGSPQYAQYDAALNQTSGIQEQQQNVSKTYGDPASNEAAAQAIASFKAPPITGRALTTPTGAGIMARAYAINPKLNGTEYATAENASKAFATGSQGDTVRSLNVSINHLNTLSNLTDALKNGDTPAINQIANQYKQQTGATAPTNFNAAREIVANEIIKAVTASGGTGADREKAQEVINSSQSPAQLKGVINTYQQLLGGQRQGLGMQYRAATGRDDFDSKFTSGNSAAPVATKPVARTGTVNGRKVVLYQDGTSAYGD